MSSAEKISRLPSIDCIIWLLVSILAQVCNEREQVGQREVQNVQFVEKKNTRRCNIGAKSHAKGDKFKETPDAQENKELGTLGARSYQLSIQLVKRIKGKLKGPSTTGP